MFVNLSDISFTDFDPQFLQLLPFLKIINIENLVFRRETCVYWYKIGIKIIWKS